MKNKILFFSIDRLGDYLIRSNVIHCISKHYNSSEIICSEKNYKLIKKQIFFNKVFLFDTTKTINKIKFIINFFFKKYDALISFDGKNISNILLLFMRASFKHIFIYKKNSFLDNFKTDLYCNLLKLLDISYTILYSREYIETYSLDHYPSKYRLLKKYYNNISDKTYYIENFHLDNDIQLYESFIMIHLDEKFNDIIDIHENFTESLNLFAKNFEKKIILTAYKNNNNYYKNLLINKIPFQGLEYLNQYKEKIFILEDVPLVEFYNLIKKSDLNISCHGGFFVHASLLNNKNTIDIINNSDEKWLNTWITKSDSYKIVYKSNSKKKKYINEILLNLNNTINEF